MTVTLEGWRITGQPQIDSYVGTWVQFAATLVNRLAVTSALGRSTQPPVSGLDRLAVVREVLAEGGWPPETTVSETDAHQLADVATELSAVFCAGDALDSDRLNALLIRHAAVPNLHGGSTHPYTLTFHRPGATIVDAWAADAGTALAMVIGVGQSARLGHCQASSCDLVFFDTTRNASRRFCGVSCQNRVKASAYRARRGSPSPT
ncbi:CGNR zinc finger domain-containing protein [Streptosporangiaceae bacterium NEAU-GS5]|nr:CGNR zinc finger domain-containing protein [Streptosporangiaceae bacterium NEAU-GS5]